MRLLIVSARHHPTQGGIGTAVWWFIHHATRAGWHIELMTRPSNVLPPNVKHHLISTKDTLSTFEAQIAPLRHIEKIRPYQYGLWSLAVAERLLTITSHFDAVEFVDSQAEGLVALTSKMVRDRYARIPMYIRAHTPMFLVEALSGMDRNRFGRRIYHEWEATALANADGVIAPSSMLLDHVECTRPAAVIPHLLPVMKETHRVREKSKTILCVGNVEPHKGVDVWARSLNIVFDQCREANAILVGADTTTAPDGGSMASYVTSLVKPAMRHRFQWVGPMSQDQVERALQIASMVVVPSQFESFSFVAAESLLKGSPTILSDRVGVRQWASDCPCFESGNVRQLAERQIDILRNSAGAESTARQCAQVLSEACDPSRVLNLNEEFLRSLRGSYDCKRQQGESTVVMQQLLAQIEDEAFAVQSVS